MPVTAVRTTVSEGRVRPSGPKLSVQSARRYAFSKSLRGPCLSLLPGPRTHLHVRTHTRCLRSRVMRCSSLAQHKSHSAVVNLRRCYSTTSRLLASRAGPDLNLSGTVRAVDAPHLSRVNGHGPRQAERWQP